jgi:hypothetical protein
MPIVSSGQIALIADIEAEFDQPGTEDISLLTARDDAGLGSGEISMQAFYGQSDVVAATVVTNSASSVSYNSMTINGNVTNDGGGTITSRGFYFGTSSNYASNTKYTVGSGTGTFSRSMTSISASTTYYATAFAINAAGEVRGSTVSQATNAAPIAVSISYASSGNAISTYANQGPFNGYVYYGSCRSGFTSLSRSMPANSMYNHTFGKQCASGVSWYANDYEYIPSMSSGGSRNYSWYAEGNATNSYINSARSVYGQVYAVGNYSLTRNGSPVRTVHLH